MGGKRKPSSPQQSSRQIRFTMRMPSTPSSEYSCTPEKKQKKSDDLALQEAGSHMELDAAAPGMDGDSMTGPSLHSTWASVCQGVQNAATSWPSKGIWQDLAPVARPLFRSSAFGTAGSVKVFATKETSCVTAADGEKPRKLPSADPLEQQEGESQQPQQTQLDEEQPQKLPSADSLEQEEGESQQPQTQLDKEKPRKLPSADPVEQQATDSEQSQTQPDGDKCQKLPAADPLEQLGGVICEVQKMLDGEKQEKHRKLPSADPLEQQEAADSEQMQKKPLPPLPYDLKVALEELRTFLDVPDCIAQQKAKTLGIFGPKA